nr:ion channel [Burkholderiales bacterium]
MAAIDVDREARHASVLLLFLRRMRAPLLVLIVTYAVAIVGLVAIPGMDDHGRPIRISFLHAFYVVSYTATTIGFGETPYPFTAAQRLWASCWIYLTVVGWLYAIGKLLALMQDSGFQQVVQAARFARAVRRLREPFHVVCGLGETGSLFVTAIDDRGGRAVALDADVARVQALDVAALRVDVPALAADARRPGTLVDAGLGLRRCAGVV